MAGLLEVVLPDNHLGHVTKLALFHDNENFMDFIPIL